MFVPVLPRQRLSRRYQIYGVAMSLFLHVVVLLGLTVVGMLPYFALPRVGWDANALEASFGNAEQDANPPPNLVQILPAPGTGAPPPPEPELPADPSQVTDRMVQTSVDASVAKAARRSDTENLQQLDQMSQRLNQVASSNSVGELAGAFRQFVGTKPRANQPAERPASPEFDHSTAQFHEVKRYPKEPSGWRYVAVLLDADGRTLEVDMDELEGERAYATFERIKSNPLLEQVYRQILMPLLDKMLGGQGVAGQGNKGQPTGTSE